MGEAHKRLMVGSKIVKFDLSAPKYMICEADFGNLVKDVNDKALATANATRLLISVIVQSTFPNGMDRSDGRMWAVWQEFFIEQSLVLEIPRFQLEWLRKHIINESLKIPHGLSSWREELVRYLDLIMNEEAG